MSIPEECPLESGEFERRNTDSHDHAVRIALLEQGMRNITAELHIINASMSRLVWIGVTAIGVGIMDFIVRGGLIR